MEHAQSMTRAARAPAPTSGTAVAIAPLALELELDAVSAEEALLVPGEVVNEEPTDVAEEVLVLAEEPEDADVIVV